MSNQDYLKNEAWAEIASTTNDVELKECLMRGYGEVEDLPHDELDLLYTKRRKYKILDFGCGIGRNFRYLKSFATEVHGYDTPEMIERCNELCSTEIDLLTSDWDRIKEERYDIVVAYHVFQHLTDPDHVRAFLEDLSKITSSLYLLTRCYMDSPNADNVAKIIQEDPNFEIVMENCNIDQFSAEEHPSDSHAQLICKSNVEEKSIAEVVDFNFYAPFADGSHKFVYRSYADAVKDIKKWCDDIPEVSGVCGIPRSGSFIAAVISEYRNIPLYTVDGILNDNFCWRPHISRPLNTPSGPILVVDDTSWSGASLKRAQAYLKNKGDFLYACLYINEEREDDVDLFYGILPTVYHSWEWSFLRDPQCQAYMCDLDGVFCPDYTGGINEGEEYVRHIQTSTPTVYVPKYPLMKICTARLHKHRKTTEEWLAFHKIKYKQLLMSPYHSIEERFEKNGFGEWKSEMYDDCPEAILFVESEQKQAMEIWKNTRRPVFCVDTMTLYGGSEIDVPSR